MIERRKVVSLSIALSFIVIIITGLLMYLRPFESSMASVHTSFGFIFILTALIHIWNNRVALKKYAKGNRSSFPLNKTSFYLLSFLGLLAYLFYTGTFGFGSIFDWGSEYRNAQLGKERISKKIELVSLDDSKGNYHLEIEGKLGNSFRYPMFAFWIEDMQGNYLQTIYVSESIGTSIFDYKKGQKGKHIIRRPSGLPVWAHKRNIKAADGLMVPLGNQPDLDGYTGATPLEDFIIKSSFQNTRDSIVHIYFEINQSYDWNEYYTENKFPDDSIYTLTGQPGQPSLIYTATLNLIDLNSTTSHIMTPIGHGHHSGKNGTLFLDLSNITTAYDIVQRVLLTLTQE